MYETSSLIAGAFPVAAAENELMRIFSLVTRSLAVSLPAFFAIGILTKDLDGVTGDALTSDARETARAIWIFSLTMLNRAMEDKVWDLGGA